MFAVIGDIILSCINHPALGDYHTKKKEKNKIMWKKRYVTMHAIFLFNASSLAGHLF